MTCHAPIAAELEAQGEMFAELSCENKSTRTFQMSAISKLRVRIAKNRSGAVLHPKKRGHLLKLLWDLKVARCEYFAAMGGFSEAARLCSAFGLSDPDSLQKLKFAASIQARALVTYERAVNQVLKLVLFGEQSPENPDAHPVLLAAEQLLSGLESEKPKGIEFVNLAGEVPIIELPKLRDILLQYVNRGRQEKSPDAPA